MRQKSQEQADEVYGAMVRCTGHAKAQALGSETWRACARSYLDSVSALYRSLMLRSLYSHTPQMG